MADIYVFSDSIGYGAWDEKGGWVDRLKQSFMQEKLKNSLSAGIEVVNLAIDGDTSGDVAKRIKSELQSRRKAWSTPEDIVIIAIGTNDVFAEGSPKNFIFKASDYRKNLEAIYSVIKQLQLKPIFISLDPVNETETNPCSWGAYYWTNSRIKEFNIEQEKFCIENNIPRIDLFEKMLSLPNFKDLLFDGAHPNSSGHKWMYEQIKPKILELMQ